MHINSQLPEPNCRSLVMKITHASNARFKSIQQTSPRPTSTALHELCPSQSRHHTALSRSQAQHRLPGHPMDLQPLCPAVWGDQLPSDLPKPTPPTLFHSFLSSHNTGREQLAGLKGLTGSKIPFSKIAHHPTSVPFLGCGIHLQGAIVLLGAQTPGPVNRSRAESVLDGFQQTCHKLPS